MKGLYKPCPECGKSVWIPWKRRGRAGYCSTTCAYKHRTIHCPKVVCKECGKTFYRKGGGTFCSVACRATGYRGFKHEESAKSKMKAAWTPERRAARTRPLSSRTCLVCGVEFYAPTYGKGSTRKICSEGCRVAWMKTDNPVHDPEVYRKVSEAARNRSRELKDKIGEGVSRAWRDGKFDGVRTGRCKWYRYTFGDSSWKVQGAWELAFIDWLCNRGVPFLCHRGWIHYLDKSGKARFWYPDFWVEPWQAWVDAKADHFYDPDKFDRIRACNPGINVVVLLRQDLEGLGVKLYAEGNKYHKDLQALLQRCCV